MVPISEYYTGKRRSDRWSFVPEVKLACGLGEKAVASPRARVFVCTRGHGCNPSRWLHVGGCPRRSCRRAIVVSRVRPGVGSWCTGGRAPGPATYGAAMRRATPRDGAVDRYGRGRRGADVSRAGIVSVAVQGCVASKTCLRTGSANFAGTSSLRCGGACSSRWCSLVLQL